MSSRSLSDIKLEKSKEDEVSNWPAYIPIILFYIIWVIILIYGKVKDDIAEEESYKTQLVFLGVFIVLCSIIEMIFYVKNAITYTLCIVGLSIAIYHLAV